MDHALGLRGEMRLLGRERIGGAGGHSLERRPHHGGQSQRAEAHAEAVQECAPGEEVIIEMRLMMVRIHGAMLLVVSRDGAVRDKVSRLDKKYATNDLLQPGRAK